MQCVCERRERERKGNYGSIKIDNARCSSSLCPSFPTYLAYLRTSIPLLLLLLMLLMQSRFSSSSRIRDMEEAIWLYHMMLSHIYRIRKLLCERWDDLDCGKRAGEKTTTATTRHTIKLSLARLFYRSHLNSTWTIHPIVSHAAMLNTRLNHIISNHTYLIPSIFRHSTHERVTIFWRNPAHFRHTIRKRKSLFETFTLSTEKEAA